MTANTSLAKGRDPRYLSEGADAGHAGGTRYYSEAAGEPPGQWAGRAAVSLGLAGDVDPDELQALYMDRVGPDGVRLESRRRAQFRPVREREELAVAAHLAVHPLATEGELEAVRAAERAKSQHSVPYFDFTVSAAKSISVLHASLLVSARRAREAGATEVARDLERQARAITDALLVSARAAVARVERALFVRTGYHSATSGEYRDAAGATAAMFLQHTSREGDPQLHVHIAVMNLAQREDGADTKWRTLHGSMLYQERLAVAVHASRELASRLSDLGYVLVPRADGNGFEVGGVAQEVMDAFSSRRAQITPEVRRMAEEYRQRYGREPSQRTLWAMAQDATMETRKAKSRGRADRSGQPSRSAGQELDAWEVRTTEREIDALSEVHEAVAAFVRPEGLDAPAELDASSRARIIRVAVAGTQKSSAAWTRASLLWEIHRAMPAMAAGVDQAALAEELADQALASGEVLALGPTPDLVDVAALGVRASDGRSVFTPPGAERYTTAAHLDLEEYLVAEARREVPQLVTAAQANAALATSDLDGGQAEVAAGLLTARTAVSVLVAPAGAGKTHTMAAFARAWTSWTGGRVLGVTLSTNAARVMASEGLAEAVNVAQFLGRLEDGGSKGAMRVGPRDVVVVDEASQVSTQDLAAIQAVVRAGGARLILTGDTAQLGAVDAGGMMRLVAEDLGHWELAEVRRFDAEWERLASLQLRQGARAVLRAYDARGRIRGNAQPAAERDAVALYLADYLMGRDTMLLAGTNEEAARLASLVRAELARLGQVPERGEVTLADGNAAARGDLVRARQNTPAVDAAGRALTNRDTLRLDGTVLAAGSRVAIMRRQLPGGGWSRDFPVSLEYLRTSAELAYAANVYVAQGRTVDTAHLYVSASLTRESLYVGMTRGRSANTAHVLTGPGPVKGEPLAQAQPEAVLAEILDRTESTRTATEAMREAQTFATNTAHLLAMYTTATRGDAYAAVDAGLQTRLSPRDYARYQAESQRPVFQRQVLAATLAGADLDQVLEAATGQEFTRARSVAAVMHGRVKAAGLEHAHRGQTVTWAERVPEVIRPETRHLGLELAEAMDAKADSMAHRLAEAPEPWVLNTLGPFPADGSPPLQADWLGRVGQAASYREAAGITDPNMVVGPAPQGHPELAEAHAGALRALEIRSPDAMVWSMTRGQLEATVDAYARVRASAPAEVSQELRAEHLAEADARARGAELAVLGEHQAAQQAMARADRADVRARVLEGRAEVYAQWDEATVGERQAAELAQAELDRRAQSPDRGQAGPGVVTEAESAVVSAEADTASDQVQPGTDAETRSGIEDLDMTAVTEDLDAIPLPELDTSTPSRKGQARTEVWQARQAEVREAKAEAADRAARREAYRAAEASPGLPAAEAEAPSAWVPGPHTASWGGPGIYTPEPAPAAEPEAAL